MSDAGCCQLTLKLSVVTSLLLTLTGTGTDSTHTDTTQEPRLLLGAQSDLNQCDKSMCGHVILTSCEAVCEGIGLSLIVDGVDGHGVLCQRAEVT